MKSHINEYNRMCIILDEMSQLRRDSDELTRKIEKARTLPGEILESCELPIDGISIVDGEPLINGLPVSNLSDGEKLNLCIDVATQKSGSLNLLLIDGIEKLSGVNRAALYEKLKSKGVQFVSSRTTDENVLRVVQLED